jgi:UDP-GlcNAc:undecaprenyl-phosphate GlcNAc-1-phosphate transferase
MNINYEFFLFNIIISLISIILIESLKKKESALIIFDKPDNNRKIHTKPIPLLGGPIILFYIYSILIFLFFYSDFKFKLILILCLLYFVFFILGFIDDKNGISPLKKTLIIFSLLFLILPLDQNLLIKNLVFKDIKINILLNQASIFFTIFCIYIFFNILNFSDGVNGIALGISVYWIVVFLIFGNFNNLFLISFLICIFIILIYNIKNDLFIGNSGSSILSSILASLFILEYNIHNTFYCDEIFLLMFLPATDAARISIERVTKKASPFLPDKNHFHHLLMKKVNTNYVFLIYVIFSILPFLLSFTILKTYYSFLLSIIIYFSILLFLKKSD